MRKHWRTIILILVLVGAVGWWFRKPVVILWQTTTCGVELKLREKLQPDPETYRSLVAKLRFERMALAKRHKTAKTETQRNQIEQQARILLEKTLPAMMHCWLGTPWDFNGTAAKPGSGKIACGYFVSTVLRDAGFQVDRYRLAQQASENILRSFLPRESCDLTIGEDYAHFSDDLEKREHGVYLVGLDTHVGFLIVEGNKFRMFHSSGSRPWCVVDQDRKSAHGLQGSNWRMIGNLTSDSLVLEHWLNADKIIVKGT